MITLANYDGIGEKTLEKAFNYVLNSPKWKETIFNSPNPTKLCNER